MSSYQLTGEQWIYRVSDQARIHPQHPDYQDYLAWLEAGNTPLPPSQEQLQEVRSQMQCSDVQGLLAIEQTGYAAQYEAWASGPTRTFTEKVFLRSTTWRRLDPVLTAAATEMGISDEELDDLFRLAMTL